MYFKVTKTYLQNKPKKHLLYMLGGGSEQAHLTKKVLTLEILSRIPRDPRWGQLEAYISVCEYCRRSIIIYMPSEQKVRPIVCVNCGRTSPNRTFLRNLERTSQLLLLASRMKAKNERATKAILLEQSVVTVITSLEVLLRDVYSLVLDHKHVIYGESIYNRLYDSTRNEFLGLGSTNSKLRKEIGLNLKEKLEEDKYKFLSRMFSTRHIIVHNCSIKDKDYISQTGEDASNLNKQVGISMRDIRKLISIAKRVGVLADSRLIKCMLEYQDKQTAVQIESLENSNAI